MRNEPRLARLSREASELSDRRETGKLRVGRSTTIAHPDNSILFHSIATPCIPIHSIFHDVTMVRVSQCIRNGTRRANADSPQAHTDPSFPNRYQARLAQRPLLTQSITTAVCSSLLPRSAFLAGMQSPAAEGAMAHMHLSIFRSSSQRATSWHSKG